MRHILLLLSVLVLALPIPSRAQNVIMIEQITDSRAAAAHGMFRFAPDFVDLPVGATLRFQNTRGHHTVHSIPELWPDGVDRVAIMNQPAVEISFDQPGYYGFFCKRHGRYGMAMLVKVGAAGPPEELLRRIRRIRAPAAEKQTLERLVKQNLLNR